MKIAFYIPVLNIGGAEKVVVDLLTKLSESGNKLYLLTDASKSMWLKEIAPGIQIVHVSSEAFFLKRLFNLARAIKENEFDVVVSHLTHSNIHCLLVKLVFNYKLVIVEHSITSAYIKSLGKINYQVKKWLIQRLFNSANLIIAVSEATRKDLIEVFAVKNEKCVVIYNPLDFKKISFLANLELSDSFRKIKGNRKILVSVGRLEPIKNHLFLIESIKEFLVTNNLLLVIIGDGSEKERLRLKIAAEGLANYVLLTGFDDNPYKYVQTAQCLIHPSLFEGFGLVLIEALFLSTPVISMDFEVAYEVLDGGKMGTIVTDKESMLHALNNMLLADNVQNAVQNSKQVEAKYALNSIAGQYVDVFFNLNGKALND